MRFSLKPLSNRTYTPKTWHYWAAASALGVGTYLLLKKSSPSLTFNGPAEDYAPIEGESGCDLSEKPGVAFFRKYVMKHFGGSDMGILRECSIGGDSGHKLGKSWDWGNTPTMNADGLLKFLFANNNEVLRRAGITYLIWQRRIWNTRAQGWQNYTGSDPHTSHIHFSFGTPGAMGRTSFYRSGIA